jgi:hypothetical protein
MKNLENITKIDFYKSIITEAHLTTNANEDNNYKEEIEEE